MKNQKIEKGIKQTNKQTFLPTHTHTHNQEEKETKKLDNESAKKL